MSCPKMLSDRATALPNKNSISAVVLQALTVAMTETMTDQITSTKMTETTADPLHLSGADLTMTEIILKRPEATGAAVGVEAEAVVVHLQRKHLLVGANQAKRL